MSRSDYPSSSFYKISNEEQISKELEDVDNMKKLQEDIEQKNLQLEIMKDRMIEKRIAEIERQKIELKQRYQDLENRVDYEDTDDKFKIIDAKRKVDKVAAEEKEKHDELVQRRKEQELEKIVRKKMEIERLQEDRKKLNDQYKHAITELEVIKEEKDTRDMDNVKMLEKALNRANLIQDQLYKGALPEEDVKLLAETYFDDGMEAKKEQERLLYEIQAHRFQESQKANLDTKEKIKNLNDIRFALIEKQEELLKKKALQTELRKKGVEFLAQVELGDAPPIDILAKNIKTNPDQYRKQMDLQAVLKKSKDYVLEAQQNIVKVIKEHEETKIYLKKTAPYNGEFKPWLELAHPVSKGIAKYIIDIIIGRAFDIIFKNQKLLQEAKEKSGQLEAKSKQLERRNKLMETAKFSRDIGSDLIDNVVEMICREIAFETYKINENAKNLSILVIMKALKIERNMAKNELDIKDDFFKLRGIDLKKKKEKFKFFFKDRTEIPDKEIKESQKKGLKQIEADTGPKKKADYGEIELKPDGCIENIGEFDVRKFELEYWESLALSIDDKIEIFSKVKGGIQALAISNNGYLLAVATTAGLIAVVSLRTTNPEVISYIEAQNYAPVLIRFSHDSSSQLICLDNQGVVKVFLIQGPPVKSVPFLTLKETDNKPMEMSEYYKLDYRFIMQSAVKIGNERENLFVTFTDFFAQYTVMGFQPCVLVGTKNGTIMKFNSNKLDANQMKNMVFRTSNIKSFNKPEIEMKDDVIKPKNGPKTSPYPHLFREFFKGHVNEVMFIGFIEKPENLLTIDKEGKIYLWKYDEDHFASEGHFQPDAKYKINLVVLTFEPIGKKEQTFPAKTKIKDEAALRSEQIARYRAYENSVDFKSKLLGTARTKDLTEYLLYKTKLPPEGQSETFQIITMNSTQRIVVSEFEQQYRALSKPGFVGYVQGSANNRFIYIQLILAHKVKPDSNNIVFVGFNTLTNNLKKLKITLEVPKLTSGIEFIVQDNFRPLDASYLYMSMRDGIYVFSLATGLIVRIIKDHINKLDPILRNKITFDAVAIFNKKEFFLGSTSSNLIWRFHLKDSNNEEYLEKADIYANDFMNLINI